jgi:hypothetical protein
VLDVLGVRPDEVTLRTSSSFGSTVSPVHRVYARSDRDRWCIDVLSQVKSAQIPFRAPLVPLFKKKNKPPMGVIWGPDLKTRTPPSTRFKFPIRLERDERGPLLVIEFLPWDTLREV